MKYLIRENRMKKSRRKRFKRRLWYRIHHEYAKMNDIDYRYFWEYRHWPTGEFSAKRFN